MAAARNYHQSVVANAGADLDFRERVRNYCINNISLWAMLCSSRCYSRYTGWCRLPAKLHYAVQCTGRTRTIACYLNLFVAFKRYHSSLVSYSCDELRHCVSLAFDRPHTSRLSHEVHVYLQFVPLVTWTIILLLDFIDMSPMCCRVETLT